MKPTTKHRLIKLVKTPIQQTLKQRIEQQKNKLPHVPVVTPVLAKLSKKAAKTIRKKNQPDDDVLIIGAGVAGIAMGCHLSQYRPSDRFTILEQRADMGGTWDLFKYPGIRSDSDMTTFAMAARPWLGKKTLVDGPTIKQYLKDSAADHGINQRIRYNKQVAQLAWSSKDNRWHATVKDQKTGKLTHSSARFVVAATGYYDFNSGYRPSFTDEHKFRGQIIHPQQWHDGIHYHNKKIIVIGSGATAVTLVPALVDATAKQQAAHVTMLQRTPTYIASVPSSDDSISTLSSRLAFLSPAQAYQLVRARNVMFQQGLYQLSQRTPFIMKTILKWKNRADLKGSGISLKHFTPSYNPWDERLCAVPDGDLFHALKQKQASIITGTIDRFTKTGIRLTSGEHIEADLIVTATGLNLQLQGGAQVLVDGNPVHIGEHMTYKAVMLNDVPNMAVMFGYTNASWTLKIDLAAMYVLRLLKYMERHRYQVATPVATGVSRQSDTVMGSLSSGYIQRAQDVLPKQGDRYPWVVQNNYLKDRVMLLHRKIADEWLKFR